MSYLRGYWYTRNQFYYSLVATPLGWKSTLNVIAHLQCRKRERDLSPSPCNVNIFCKVQCRVRIRVGTRARLSQCKYVCGAHKRNPTVPHSFWWWTQCRWLCRVIARPSHPSAPLSLCPSGRFSVASPWKIQKYPYITGGSSIKQECIPVGCVPSAPVTASWGGGVCPGACLCRGVLAGGVCPPVNRITDRCKNITLPQLRCGREKWQSGDKF